MSARPTCRSCAPCASSGASGEGDRLARVLAAGMRLGPGASPSTDTIFVRKPDFETCSICLEPMLSGVSRENAFVALESCQHAFHVECMAGYLRATPDATCPTCRTEIPEDEANKIMEYGQETREEDEGKIFVYKYDSLVRIENPNGKVEFYEGEPSRERLVRVLDYHGTKSFYEGEKDKERLVMMEFRQ